jgi:hypothetical protein
MFLKSKKFIVHFLKIKVILNLKPKYMKKTLSGRKVRSKQLRYQSGQIPALPAIVLLVLLFMAFESRSQLLIEDFSYTNGSAITANGWTAHSAGGTNTIFVTNPSTISYPGYLSSGVGGEITTTTSGEDDNKTFTAQTSGTLYAGFLVNVTSALTGDYFFHLGPATISTTFRGRVFVKKDAGNNLYFGVANSTTTAAYTTATYAMNTTYLIVLKYDIISGGGNGSASIYINPPLNAPIPSSGWLAATDATGSGAANVGAVAVRQGSSSSAAALKLDGIRVSTDWAQIVGVANAPVLTVIPSFLTGLSYQEGAGPSASQSYMLSGLYLTGYPDNITVTAPTDFEVSSDNSTFGVSASIPFTSATLTSTPVYVRLKSGLSLGYFGNEVVANAGGGATPVNVACNGAVVLPEPTNYPTAFAVDTAGQLFITLTWTDATEGTLPSGYIIKAYVGTYLMTTPVDFTAEADGLLVKNVAQGVQTVTFTGIEPNTTYCFRIWPYTNSGSYIDYKTDYGAPQTEAHTRELLFLSAASGNWNSPSTWLINDPNNGSWLPATTEIPIYKTSPVMIAGNSVTYPSGFSNGKAWELILYPGASLKANSSSGSCYLSIYYHLNNNGEVGGATDVLGLDIEGSNVTINGSGSTIISRMAKYTTNTSSTFLEVLQPITLTYTSTTTAALWNQNPGSTSFTIQVNGACITANNANVDMNGINFILTESNSSSVIFKSVSGSGSFATWMRIYPWTDDTHGWHLFSSPVTSQSIAPDFIKTPAANYDFYKWDEVSDTWLNQKTPENNITAFDPGTGYLVAYQSTLNASFNGTINTGNITVNNLTISGGTYSGWNLLGNPFPSAIKWNDGTNWTVPAQFAATAKVWNEPTAAYVDIAPNGFIPKLNGFMVQVVSGSPTSMTIPSAARVHDYTPFYKEAGENLKLVAYDHTGNTAQECIIGVNESATGDYDRDFDSRFLAGYAPQFYAMAGEEMLSTDILPAMTTGTSVPLGFVKNGQNEFSIGLDPASGVPELPVYLTDKKTGAETEMKQGVEYTFTSEEGDAADRFLLHFGPLGIDDPAALNPFHVYTGTGQIYILSNQDEKATLYLTSLTGQEIASMLTEARSLTTISSASLRNGVYIVSMTSDRGIYSQKVIVRN